MHQTQARCFRDVPADVKQLIFEQLKLSDLLHIIEADTAFLEPAVWAFRYKHRNSVIHINGPGFYYGSMFNISFRMGPGLVELQNYETSKRVLQTFGSCIQRLHISCLDMKQSEIVDINDLIRTKCGERLIHFGVTFPTANMHSEVITSILPNVESVSLSGGDVNADAQIDLNQQFPKMHTLELDRLYHMVDDHYFPHLKRLKVHFPYGGLNESEIERVLQRNPQINSVTAIKASPNFLTILHNNLFDLEELELFDLHWDFFTVNGPTVHFESVKRIHLNLLFSMTPNWMHIPFSFGQQLEEIKMFWRCSELNTQWIQFIENNSNIQRFEVEFDGGNCGEYAQLGALQLPHLKELKLHRIQLVKSKTDELFNKIKQWGNIERIDFGDVAREQVDLLRNCIDLEWNLNIFRSESSEELVDVVITKI